MILSHPEAIRNIQERTRYAKGRPFGSLKTYILSRIRNLPSANM